MFSKLRAHEQLTITLDVSLFSPQLPSRMGLGVAMHAR
jgi:hypothetical protein